MKKINFLGLAAALFILLVIYPFFSDFAYSSFIFSLVLSFILLLTVFTFATRGRAKTAGIVIVIPALVFNWMIYLSDHPLIEMYTYGFSALFLIFATLFLFRTLFFEEKMSEQTVYGAIALYLLLGLAWAEIYSLIVAIDPNAFSATIEASAKTASFLTETAIYYSFVTLTTLGYGDIVPLSAPAKFLSILEAISGQLFIATAIARAIGMSLSTHRKK